MISIMSSSILRRVLTHRHVLFLGGISFPMYLLHPFLLRTILAWVVFGLIPNVFGEAVGIIKVISVVLTFLAYVLWMVFLVYLSTVWKNRVDTACILVANWAEQILTG
jgi:peptidoglycan/LPS O-acetylase OafA/YrhL